MAVKIDASFGERRSRPKMKKTIYVHLTNKCGLACPSCYSCSSPCGKRFIHFEEFKEAVRFYDNWPIEVSLEGGEPFMHPHFSLLLEYLAAMENVKKIYICTNGCGEHKIIQKLQWLDEFTQRTHSRVDLRFEFLSDIIAADPTVVDTAKEAVEWTALNSEENPMLSVSFDVRWKDENDRQTLLQTLKDNSIPFILASFNQLLAYGRLKGSDYPLPQIPMQPASWACIAFDGTDFQQDLAARADYEASIVKQEMSAVQSHPVFDSKNHRRMWQLTAMHLAEAKFETRNRINVLEMQRSYINSNLNKWTREMSGKADSYADYYVSLFPERNDEMQNPFDIEDVCARRMTCEFFSAVQSARTTMYASWFAKSIRHAMDLAEAIANLPVKIGIPTTEAKSVWLLRGED